MTDEQVAEQLDRLTELCRKAGIRLTRQRLEVFRELIHTDSHPDAETVCERVRRRLPRVSLDTIYRTLASLEKIGIINKVSALHGAARFDADPSLHHHFVCKICGQIQDFSSLEPESLLSAPQVQALGQVDSVHAEVRGVCQGCLENPQPRRRRSAVS